jgi:hypothetical protein
MTGGAGFTSNAITSQKNNRRLFKKDRSFGKKKLSVSGPKSAYDMASDKKYLAKLNAKLKLDRRKTDVKRIALLVLAVLIVVVSYFLIKIFWNG